MAGRVKLNTVTNGWCISTITLYQYSIRPSLANQFYVGWKVTWKWTSLARLGS